MADVVVAAGVHAARDVELEVADVVQVVEVVEAALDRLGDRDRLRVGERAEVAARAADDVGQEADVRRREPERLAASSTARAGPICSTSAKTQVLLVRDADFAEAVAVGEVGDRIHLLAVTSPGGAPVRFSDSVTIA